MRTYFENARLAEQFFMGIVNYYSQTAVRILEKISFIFLSLDHSNILCTFEASNIGLPRSQYFLNW